MRIYWEDHVSNEEALRRAREGRRLITLIRKRQVEFLGNIMRKEQLEDIITTGKIEGKRRPGKTTLELSE